MINAIRFHLLNWQISRNQTVYMVIIPHKFNMLGQPWLSNHLLKLLHFMEREVGEGVATIFFHIGQVWFYLQLSRFSFVQIMRRVGGTILCLFCTMAH